jgi:hypothetical protein
MRERRTTERASDWQCARCFENESDRRSLQRRSQMQERSGAAVRPRRRSRETGTELRGSRPRIRSIVHRSLVRVAPGAGSRSFGGGRSGLGWVGPRAPCSVEPAASWCVAHRLGRHPADTARASLGGAARLQAQWQAARKPPETGQLSSPPSDVGSRAARSYPLARIVRTRGRSRRRGAHAFGPGVRASARRERGRVDLVRPGE